MHAARRERFRSALLWISRISGVLLISGILPLAGGAAPRTTDPGYRPRPAASDVWIAQAEALRKNLAPREGNPWEHLDQPIEVASHPYDGVKSTPTRDEQRRIRETIQAWELKAGRGAARSVISSGIDAPNNLGATLDIRIDQWKPHDLYNSARRKEVVAQALAMDMPIQRISLPNHLFDVRDPKWTELTDPIMGDFKGLEMILSGNHYGVEDWTKTLQADGTVDWEKSYYSNPAWPDYFAQYMAKLYERYGDQTVALLNINEPEVVANFAGSAWYAGGANSRRFYVDRSLNMAFANVKARISVEDVAARRGGARPVFFHNDATAYHAHLNPHDKAKLFLASDLMLGQDWVLKTDFAGWKDAPLAELTGRLMAAQDKSNDDMMRKVLFEEYVLSEPAELHERRRGELVAKMLELQGLHASLLGRHGITARDRTIFGVDYYMHNETSSYTRPHEQGLNRENPFIYPQEINDGHRRGVGYVLEMYYERYKMPMAILETGTFWREFGMKWQAQIDLELADLARRGIPVVMKQIFPLLDTVGWDKCQTQTCGVDKQLSGIISHEGEVRDWGPRYMKSLNLLAIPRR